MSSVRPFLGAFALAVAGALTAPAALAAPAAVEVRNGVRTPY
jgi:hypothetical protein